MRGKLAATALALALALWWLCSGSAPAPVVVGAFNIQVFPNVRTDLDRVAERITELDADLFAVQEIADVARLEQVLAAASVATGRQLRFAHASYCGYPELYIGVVYDAARYRLAGERRYTTPEMCRRGHPTAYLAVLETAQGERVGMLSVHMKAGGDDAAHRIRRTQWRALVRTFAAAERELAIPIVAAGDFNSTGFLDDSLGEREFIDRTVAAAGLELVTRDLPCTMYWRPHGPGGPYVPNTLDHILVRRGRWDRARSLGMCQRHACQVQSEPIPDWEQVSDHCPVAATWHR